MKHPLPKTLLSLIPVLVLVALLAVNIGIFGADSILGASQVALLASAGVAVLIATLAFKTSITACNSSTPKCSSSRPASSAPSSRS